MSRRDRKRPRTRGRSPDTPPPTPRRRRLLPIALTLAVIAAVVTLIQARPPAKPPAAPPPPPSPTYIGATTCTPCHPRESERWHTSDHARAMQPADDTTVLGNFADATFTKDGVTSTFFRRDGRYAVRTDGPDGALHDYDIAYTFGIDPLQQYLIAFPDGRYQALGIAWDTRPAAAGGQRWFHLYPDERIDHHDVLHWTHALQNWNYMCADCHSTNLRQNYQPAEDRFAPTWTDIAVACEACHGPGSGHVAWAEHARDGAPAADPLRGLTFALKDSSATRWAFSPGERIARRTQPLASHAELETCAPCHARRAPIGGDAHPGQPLEQAHRVALLDDRLYHPDGQIRDEVYEYGSFVQSRMHHAGVTCSDCHDPHSTRLRQTGNGLCAQCHLPATYDGPQHHFHAAGTNAAQCVSCHMPQHVYMGIDARRDHSFRVPRPDLSGKLGTPNACTGCHDDQSPGWAAEAVVGWYGPGRRSGWHWGEAIHAGRRWQVDAEPQLVRAIQDPAVPAIARATALSLLPPFLRPGSLPAVEASLRDPDALVRRAAATGLVVLEPKRRVALAVPLLGDPIRSVRFEALSPLLDTPRDAFTPAELATLDRVILEYRQAETSLAGRVESYLNLGALDARLGRLDAAEQTYRTGIRLQPMFLANYINLADLYRQQGREDRAIETLQAAVQQNPKAADAYAAMGLSLVRQKRLGDALPQLAKAAALGDDVPRHAYVYAVALHEAGESQRALAILERAHERYPAERDILAALLAYHRAAGNQEAAARWARALAELSP